MPCNDLVDNICLVLSDFLEFYDITYRPQRPCIYYTINRIIILLNSLILENGKIYYIIIYIIYYIIIGVYKRKPIDQAVSRLATTTTGNWADTLASCYCILYNIVYLHK